MAKSSATRWSLSHASNVFRQIKTREQFAVKSILLEEELLEDAIREVNILKSLNHKLVVRYIDSWTETLRHVCLDTTRRSRFQRRHLMIQLEFCDGGNLRNLMKNKPFHSLSDERLWTIIHEILQGLHYIHSKQLIHRDIKPARSRLQKLKLAGQYITS